MHLKEKIGQSNFRGDIEQNPLTTIVDYITFSCILSAKSGDDTGSLFFKNGELIGAELNNSFHLNKAKVILNWKKGTFYYQKWINDLEISRNHLSSILYYIELCNFNIELGFTCENKFIKIIFSEGIIVEIEPEPENLHIFFKDAIKETEGVIYITKKGGQTGDLKEFYSEYLNAEPKLLIEQSKQKSPADLNILKPLEKKSKKKSEKINTLMIEQSFKHLQNDLGDIFIAGSVYSAQLGKPIISYNTATKQSVLFAKLYKTINKLLANENFGIIEEFYILDLEEDFLLFILTIKDYHFGLAFDKSKIKLGYLFNIIKPLLINDYENALKNI